MTVIDWDNSQKSWYIIDLGTVVFELQEQMWNEQIPESSNDCYVAWFEQAKGWMTEAYGEAYGTPVDPAELT